ncbi:MtN3-like protein [Achlya hypogyna]|uniref:Sugar transporter SWEET1 n=1 Tax=Achlya hypogyna TaxID=1202772 RepID=A0A1V9YHY0_ACHHY|nr:MtN3-like protein [Achlya hypogyna]
MPKVRAKIPVGTLYGVLIHNYFPLVATNAVNTALATYYLAVIYTHAGPHRLATVKKILATTGLVFAAVLYAAYGTWVLHSRDVATHVGYLGIAVCTLMFGSPLAAVGTVVKHKSAAALPFRLILAGVLCASLWFAFGLMLADAFVYGPNGLNLALGLFQLGLCYYYRAPVAKSDAKDHADDDGDIELAKLTANVL